MNNLIRLIFFIVIIFIFMGAVSLFNKLHSPTNQSIDKISEFKLTKISGNGKLFFDKKPIPTVFNGFPATRSLNIKKMQFSVPFYCRTDDRTACQFYCFNHSLNVLPSSYFYYQPNTNEFNFYNGELYWKKEIKKEKIRTTIHIGESNYLLTLSNSGRAKIKNDLLKIWNYSTTRGNDIVLRINEEIHHIKSNQMFIISPKKPPKIVPILSATTSIDPLNKTIPLKTPEDSLIRFNWKSVNGVNQYLFRLYSSDLKENVLVEKLTQSTWLNLDLLQFEYKEFYWEVFPIKTDEKEIVEGIPSRLGFIRMVGALIGKKDIQKAPQLSIKSLTVNGNLVIIKGNADSDSQLFINDEVVKIDMDGEFLHYLTFNSMGPKRVFFRLVSILGVETTVERYVTIFAE